MDAAIRGGSVSEPEERDPVRVDPAGKNRRDLAAMRDEIDRVLHANAADLTDEELRQVRYELERSYLEGEENWDDFGRFRKQAADALPRVIRQMVKIVRSKAHIRQAQDAKAAAKGYEMFPGLLRFRGA